MINTLVQNILGIYNFLKFTKHIGTNTFHVSELKFLDATLNIILVKATLK